MDTKLKRETLTRAEQNAAKKAKPNILGNVVALLFSLFVCFMYGAMCYDSISYGRRVDRLWNEAYHKDQPSTSQVTKDTPKQEKSRPDNVPTEEHYPMYEQALTQLKALAEHGCEAPFEKCLDPWVARWKVVEAIESEDVAYGAGGVTLDDIYKLEAKADIQIISKKFAYLKANGGVKRPSELKLLEEVCRQVYYYNKKLLPNHPTDSELKQLMPPGMTEVDYCFWDYNQP